MQQKTFSESRIFTYNGRKKILFGISTIIALFLTGMLILYYILILGKSDFIVVQVINRVFSHIGSNIAGSSLLGALYASLLGGLFFVFLPLEALFVKFLAGGNKLYFLLPAYLFGMFVSYSLNFIIGSKLSGLSKKLISAKQFYGIKAKINRHGSLAVFAFNALPLPSQPLAAILGVFNYNKARFYTFFLSGQALKFLVIGIITLYFS